MTTTFSALVRKGAAWSIGGNLFSTLATFVAGIILARLLTPADFGIFMATTVFTSTLLMLCKFGLPQALIQAQDIAAPTVNAAFSFTLILSATGFALLNGIAPAIADIYDNDAVIGTVRIMSVSFLLSPIPTIGIALLRREMCFDVVTKINAASLLVSFGVSIALAAAGLGATALAVGSVASVLSTMILVLGAKIWTPRLGSLYRLSPIFRYSRFMTLNNFVVFATNRVDNLLVGALVGMASLGNYGRAFSLARIPLDQFAQSIGPLMLGSLSRLQGDRVASKALLFKATAAVSLLTFPLFGLLIVAGPDFITLVYGPQWSGAAAALGPFVLAAGVMLYYLQLQSFISAHGMAKQLVRAQVAGLASTLVLVVALAPLGLYAIGVGIALREGVILLAMLALLKKTEVPVTVGELGYNTAPALVATAAGVIAGIWAETISLMGAADPSGWRLVYMSFIVTSVYGASVGLMAVFWTSHASLQSVRSQAASAGREILRRVTTRLGHPGQ